MKRKVSTWVEGLTVSATDYYEHRGRKTLWRVFSADFYKDKVDLVRVMDEKYHWIGSTTELLEEFRKCEGVIVI